MSYPCISRRSHDDNHSLGWPGPSVTEKIKRNIYINTCLERDLTFKSTNLHFIYLYTIFNEGKTHLASIKLFNLMTLEEYSCEKSWILLSLIFVTLLSCFYLFELILDNFLIMSLNQMMSVLLMTQYNASGDA